MILRDRRGPRWEAVEGHGDAKVDAGSECGSVEHDWAVVDEQEGKL